MLVGFGQADDRAGNDETVEGGDAKTTAPSLAWVTVAVGRRTLDELDCPDDDRGAAAGCVKTSRGTLLWARWMPEEDPGTGASLPYWTRSRGV